MKWHDNCAETAGLDIAINITIKAFTRELRGSEELTDT